VGRGIFKVAPGSPAFAALLKLWRTESATLGFMPSGGFDDAARAGCLLAAESASGDLSGYVMYRVTGQNVVSIAHLCVAAGYRRSGVARALFNEVRQRCADCYEIRLRCRRDFPASTLWERFGFVAVQDDRGRGRDSTITSWRYELAPLPLFSRLEAGRSGSAVRVAIDANVFLDLDELADGDEESRSLAADWVGEFVELAVTQELFNEINRHGDLSERERQRDRAGRFVQIQRDVMREDATLPRVKALLSTSSKASAVSDARQIAMTIAGGVSFFVTRDADILAAADALDEAFGLQVASPHEIIRRFDELRREEEYRPRRLFFGPDSSVAMARADEIDEITELMHEGQANHEPRRQTLGRLREMFAAPDRYEARRIRQGDELVAAYVLDRITPGRLSVPFFGVASSSLGRTAARHFGDALVSTAAREARQIIHVEDPGLRVSEALADLGFSEEADGWIKLTLPIAVPAESAAEEVERVGASSPPAAQLARRVAAALRAIASGPGLSRARAVDLERALWPAKLTSSGLPCFVVPIQARWAKELFDRELAEGTLFGADPNLALNSENVYYRAARPEIVTAPARILWYVSDDPDYPQSKAIRACSYIDEVVVGLPKDLFRRFKRLGVYEWPDVFALAKLDVTKEIMAFRFSKTEPFLHPIAWSTMQATFRRHTDRGSQLQSPAAISEECFFDFYRQGVGARAA
jgi:GNAT superfamily N-acetyltransferase